LLGEKTTLLSVKGMAPANVYVLGAVIGSHFLQGEICVRAG